MLFQVLIRKALHGKFTNEDCMKKEARVFVVVVAAARGGGSKENLSLPYIQ